MCRSLVLGPNPRYRPETRPWPATVDTVVVGAAVVADRPVAYTAGSAVPEVAESTPPAAKRKIQYFTQTGCESCRRTRGRHENKDPVCFAESPFKGFTTQIYALWMKTVSVQKASPLWKQHLARYKKQKTLGKTEVRVGISTTLFFAGNSIAQARFSGGPDENVTSRSDSH